MVSDNLIELVIPFFLLLMLIRKEDCLSPQPNATEVQASACLPDGTLNYALPGLDLI